MRTVFYEYCDENLLFIFSQGFPSEYLLFSNRKTSCYDNEGKVPSKLSTSDPVVTNTNEVRG